MLSDSEQQRLLRVLACALRHRPLEFGIALDETGSANLDDLVVAIRHSHYDWATIDRQHILHSLASTAPGRFEVQGESVRACYGHSVVLGSPGEPSVPPDVLYHGTAAAAVVVSGLRPMDRAFVHLTSDPDYAAQVAAAKGASTVLGIRARLAAANGIAFFQANAHVWLTHEVPAEYLTANNLAADSGWQGGGR